MKPIYPDFPDICSAEIVLSHLDYIREIRKDDEIAHILEDSLHHYVLQKISEGKCTAPAACSALALESRNIDFARWCS